MSRDFGDDVGKKLLKDKKEKEKVAGMSQFDKYQLKKREKKGVKKQKAKERKDEQRKMAKMSESDVRKMEAEKQKERNKLAMLVGDVNSDEDESGFVGNKQDSRFAGALKDKAFAMDPTHKHFHKVKDTVFVKSNPESKSKDKKDKKDKSDKKMKQAKRQKKY